MCAAAIPAAVQEGQNPDIGSVIPLGKFDGVLLASDFDDTLYSSDFTVSPDNCRAIEYFIREGGHFTVATGRAYNTFRAHAPMVPLNAPVILSNGSCLYDFSTDRVVYETFLPDRVRQDLAEVAEAFPSLGFEAYNGQDVYLHNPNQITWNHLRKTKATDGVMERPIGQMPLPWSKALLEQDRPLLEQVRAYMQARWDEHYELIFSNAVLLELTEKGSNKGGMVLRLARDLGIDQGHIYCVGDNENDLPMLAVSAIPFAPSNCAAVVKAWGPRLVGSCDESCVAEIIGILDTIY